MILPKYIGMGATVAHLPQRVDWGSDSILTQCGRSTSIHKTDEEQPEDYCSECLEALDGQ